MTKKKTEAKPKVETIEKEIEVKSHPDDLKYPNAEVNEHSAARMLFWKRLTREQLNLYKDKKLVLDEAKARAFIAEAQVGDYLGIFYTFGKLVEKTADSLTLLVEKKHRFTFSLAEIDNAREMGFCQILYRDDKPYGIDLKKKITIQIIDHGQQAEEPTKKKPKKKTKQTAPEAPKETAEVPKTTYVHTRF